MKDETSVGKAVDVVVIVTDSYDVRIEVDGVADVDDGTLCAGEDVDC